MPDKLYKSIHKLRIGSFFLQIAGGFPGPVLINRWIEWGDQFGPTAPDGSYV